MAHDINKQIAETEANLHRLRTDHAQSQGMVARYRADAIRLNTSGNNKEAVSRAQQAAMAAQLAADTDAGSIVEVKAFLASQVAARDAAIDKKTRIETSNEIEARLRASGDIARALDDALKQLVDFTGWASPFIPDAKGLLDLCSTLRAQIPAEVAMIQKIVGNHGEAVMAGTAPAALKRPPAAIVKPVNVASVTVPLFCTRSLKWRDPVSGKQITVQKFDDALIPPELARVALESKAAVRMNDPLRRQHKGSVAGHPDAKFAFDLDAAMKAATAGPRLVADPIRASSPFEVTIGEPRKVSIV